MAVVVIAEAGVNHNGDLANAVKLIDAAVASGADMVKFQTFSASDLTTEFAPKADYQNQNDGLGTQQSMLQKLQLSKQDHISEKLLPCQEYSLSFDCFWSGRARLPYRDRYSCHQGSFW